VLAVAGALVQRLVGAGQVMVLAAVAVAVGGAVALVGLVLVIPEAVQLLLRIIASL